MKYTFDSMNNLLLVIFSLAAVDSTKYDKTYIMIPIHNIARVTWVRCSESWNMSEHFKRMNSSFGSPFNTEDRYPKALTVIDAFSKYFPLPPSKECNAVIVINEIFTKIRQFQHFAEFLKFRNKILSSKIYFHKLLRNSTGNTYKKKKKNCKRSLPFFFNTEGAIEV